MIKLTINTQPDDETCGPTSLHAVYKYYGLDINLLDVIKAVERSSSGGTLTPHLAKHALKLNFDTTIYINNLNIFDPTWFDLDKGTGCPKMLKMKLKTQLQYKKGLHIIEESNAYIKYLELGGHLSFKTLNVSLLKEYFKRKIPILTALSATYLYLSPRERYSSKRESIYDDIKGTPCGHFVVLCGYDEKKRSIIVADPHRENPISRNNYYKVSSNRLINAILLGVLTYDANLLIIHPKEKKC